MNKDVFLNFQSKIDMSFIFIIAGAGYVRYSQSALYQRNCVLCVGNEERGKRMTLVSSYSLEMA